MCCGCILGLTAANCRSESYSHRPEARPSGLQAVQSRPASGTRPSSAQRLQQQEVFSDLHSSRPRRLTLALYHNLMMLMYGRDQLSRRSGLPEKHPSLTAGFLANIHIMGTCIIFGSSVCLQPPFAKLYYIPCTWRGEKTSFPSLSRSYCVASACSDVLRVLSSRAAYSVKHSRDCNSVMSASSHGSICELLLLKDCESNTDCSALQRLLACL